MFQENNKAVLKVNVVSTILWRVGSIRPIIRAPDRDSEATRSNAVECKKLMSEVDGRKSTFIKFKVI